MVFVGKYVRTVLLQACVVSHSSSLNLLSRRSHHAHSQLLLKDHRTLLHNVMQPFEAARPTVFLFDYSRLDIHNCCYILRYLHESLRTATESVINFLRRTPAV